MTNEQIEIIDCNNIKSLELINLIIIALENGIDNFDIVTNLEIIRDYLKNNNMVFDS